MSKREKVYYYWLLETSNVQYTNNQTSYIYIRINIYIYKPECGGNLFVSLISFQVFLYFEIRLFMEKFNKRAEADRAESVRTAEQETQENRKRKMLNRALLEHGEVGCYRGYFEAR